MSEERTDEPSLTDIDRVDNKTAEALQEAGFETVEHVSAASPEQLCMANDVDPIAF